MKKIVNLVKNGQVYQIGPVTQAEIAQMQTDISSVSASTTANTSAISSIQTSLANVYTKSETDAHISSAISEIDTEIFVITNALPTTDINPNKIYVVPSTGDTGATNIYTEYLYDEDNASWEKIGEFKSDVDLSGYYTAVQVDSLLAALDKSWFGTQAQYNALSSTDATKLYFIYEESL